MTDDGPPLEGRWSVALDAERCLGVGNCELLQPDHFRVDDDTAIAVLIGDGTMSETEAEAVVDRCPSGALSMASVTAS